MSCLHNENDRTGLRRPADGADDHVRRTTRQPQQVVHDFLASMALDQQIEGVKTLVNGDRRRAEHRARCRRGSTGTRRRPTRRRAPRPTVPTTSPSRWRRHADLRRCARATRRSRCEWTQDGDAAVLRQRATTSTAASRGRSPSRRPTRRSTVDLEYQTEPTWDFAFVQVYDATAEEVGEPGATPTRRTQPTRRRTPASRRTCLASPATPVG